MPDRDGHQANIVEEFTRQSAAFNVSPVMNSAETLQRLLELCPVKPADRWLEVACGPGLISRGLAPKVREVVGTDITPAMLELGQAEAYRRGLHNLRFIEADATNLPFPDASFDGVVTRFSLHHIPAPLRCVRQMARVLRPGGHVVIGDHLADDDQFPYAWHQEIERLRDPSHWACLTPSQLRSLAFDAGLTMVSDYIIPFSMDYEEWIARGTGGPRMREIITGLLEQRPGGSDSFRVEQQPSGERLHLRYWLALLEKPPA